jgi:CO dehydrogenase maturation factor
MAINIAISGKGGSGKTTLSAMIIRALIEQSNRGILAVDADPNSCLGRTCGIEPEVTVAQLREQARQQKPSDSGMDRVRSFEYNIQQAVSEGAGFDLLTMGRPEGPACYCAVNNLLRQFLDKLSSAYDFVVIDNEAGMEHLSRRTTNNVDLLCIAAEPTPIGVITAQRIYELAKKLPITVREIGIIWNRTDRIKELNAIEIFGCVPYDEAVLEASMEGKTIFDVEQDSTAFSSVRKIIENKIRNVKTVIENS